MSTAREAILESIRKAGTPPRTAPSFSLPPLTNDPASLFAAKAQADPTRIVSRVPKLAIAGLSFQAQTANATTDCTALSLISNVGRNFYAS